jgi:CubicO group peptidase (beta-lactamase class C family)
MPQPLGEQHTQVGRVLDALGLTPQRVLDMQHSIASEAVSTVDEIQPILIRPSRVRWPFTTLWQINLAKLDQALRTALTGLGVGYCYMIKRKGIIAHVGASGWAQVPNDPNPGEAGAKWALHIPMNVASASKFVTAIATVRLLRSQNIDLKTPIGSFLPQYWNAPASCRAITFHDLLRHESGLGGGVTTPPGAGTFSEMRSEIARGSTGTGSRNYMNLNYVVLRVLFATVTGTLPAGPMVTTPLGSLGITNDGFWDVVSAMVYRDFVNDYVFAPASISSREFDPADDAAKAYGTPPPTPPGEHIVDGPLGSGPSGWHLSIGELVRLLDEFRAGSMMPRWRARQLLSKMYGLDSPISTNAGPAYRKGGSKRNSKSQAIESAIYLMPGGVDFALFVNSWIGPNGPIAQIDIPAVIQNSTELMVAP